MVEDDDDIREALVELLVLEGHEVVTAVDGVAALEVLDRLEPSLVLVDLMMPRMNGNEFVDRVRARGQTALPIAVLTASPGPLPDGADAVLKKPFDAGALVELVRRLTASAA